MVSILASILQLTFVRMQRTRRNSRSHHPTHIVSCMHTHMLPRTGTLFPFTHPPSTPPLQNTLIRDLTPTAAFLTHPHRVRSLHSALDPTRASARPRSLIPTPTHACTHSSSCAHYALMQGAVRQFLDRPRPCHLTPPEGLAVEERVSTLIT